MKIIKIGAIWCPSCIIVNKYFKKLKNEYDNIEFIDLDIDIDEEEISKYNIGTTLPVIILKNDKDEEVKRVVGEVEEQILINEIDNLLKNND